LLPDQTMERAQELGRPAATVRTWTGRSPSRPT